ncbi:MAG: DNA polymerase III subunit delta [Candidatus Dasytiphilus stammeri]
MKLCSEQLIFHVCKELSSCYLLVGNDSFLLQESEDIVYEEAKKQGFQEHYRATLSKNNTSGWQDIILNFKNYSLLARKRTFCLTVPFVEKEFSSLWKDRFLMLAKLLHSNSNIILIIILSSLTKKEEKSSWFTELITKNTVVLVSCFTPYKTRYLNWIKNRAKLMKLNLEEDAMELLCSTSEGNLLLLVQNLNLLRLLWPDERISIARVDKIVSDIAYFTPYQWLDSVLSGQSIRSLHILHRLRQQGSDINILCHFLSSDLITLLTFQRSLTSSYPFFSNFTQNKTRRLKILTEALKRLNHTHIKVAITLVSQLEKNIKNNDNQTLLWSKLENISLLLSNTYLGRQ